MKRPHAEAGSTLQEAPQLVPASLTQTSLKNHFRVTKTRQHDKENAYEPDGIFSPPAKVVRSPLLPFSKRQTSAQWMPSLHIPSSAATASILPGTATCAAVITSPPVMSEGGISLSTAPFEFPAPSEDTGGAADITSRLPRYGTAAAGLFSYRMPHPAHHLPVSTADPDEVSCRQRPLPAKPARMPGYATPAAFSSGTPVAAEPEFSTASLASWLPGKGCSSMQAAGCAGGESDCEDDAVSNRRGIPAAAPAASVPGHILPQAASAVTVPTPAARSACTTSSSWAHELPSLLGSQDGATAAVHKPAAACGAAGNPLAGSEECDDRGGSAAADLVSLLHYLAQGGAAGPLLSAGAKNQDEVAGGVKYHTRLEELLFGMSYRAAPTTDEIDGAEE